MCERLSNINLRKENCRTDISIPNQIKSLLFNIDLYICGIQSNRVWYVTFKWCCQKRKYFAFARAHYDYIKWINKMNYENCIFLCTALSVHILYEGFFYYLESVKNVLGFIEFIKHKTNSKKDLIAYINY